MRSWVMHSTESLAEQPIAASMKPGKRREKPRGQPPGSWGQLPAWRTRTVPDPFVTPFPARHHRHPGSRFSVPSKSQSPPSDTILASPRLLPMNRWSSVTLLVGEQKRGHSENELLTWDEVPKKMNEGKTEQKIDVSLCRHGNRPMILSIASHRGKPSKKTNRHQFLPKTLLESSSCNLPREPFRQPSSNEA